MDSKLSKVVATIIIASMLIAFSPAIAAQPQEPHAADSMWVEPSVNSFGTDAYSVGYKFNVTVWLNVTFDTYGWQVTMKFNPGQIQVSRSGLTASTTSEFFIGHSIIPVTPVIDNTTGYVKMGESLIGTDYIPGPKCDSLVWIEFQIIAAPPMGGSLSSTLNINNTDTYVCDKDGKYHGLVPPQSIAMLLYDASYTYTWVAPPKPWLAVDPSYVEFSQYPPSSLGKTFDEKIYIKSLDAAWWLTNASLNLGFNSTLIDMMSITFNPLWGATEYTYTPGVGAFDQLYIYVGNPSTTPSGDVLVATITFNVTYQGSAPPRAPGEYDETPLDIHDYKLMAPTIEIPTKPEVDGLVRIYCLVTLPLANLKVSSVTMGPEPCKGETFNVDVSIENLDPHWYLTGIQFRLSYDPNLIEPVAVTEGPFLKGFAAQQPGSQGTYLISYFETDGVYGYHVLVGDLILPNGTGLWNPPWPKGSGVFATITFRVIYQSYPENNSCPLNIIDQLAVGLSDPIIQNPVDVPLAPPVNGTYTITTALPGRMIDLYGGAVNEGYGTAHGYTYKGIGVIFPEPYGGQGLGNPMDMVVPQSQVWLFANVTYNYWPVQAKLVTFVVQMPDGSTLTTLTATTDENGVAYATFRMPWPCNNPASLFGEWKVTATVTIGDIVMTDTMTYHYDYMVQIWKVTTDKYEYNHCEDVAITVNFGTHAMQNYPVLITTVIYDELGVPIGMATYEGTVGGAAYSTYRNYTITLTIQVPKYAYAGIATVHVNAYDKDPTEGGQAWCPEYTPPPEICIQPY
jgi:hypothetical protein